jgi:hypothetical protein
MFIWIICIVCRLELRGKLGSLVKQALQRRTSI